MSILIGLHIKSVLSADRDVRQALGTRVYPSVVPVGTPAYPLVVYTVTGIRPDGTKDGDDDDVTVSLVLLHEDYVAGLKLANRIRYLFEGVSASYEDDGFIVNDGSLAGYTEDFDTDIVKHVFILQFNFKTIDL